MRNTSKWAIGMALTVVVLDDLRKNKAILGLVFAVTFLGVIGIGLLVSLNELSGARDELNAATLNLSETEVELEAEQATIVSLQEERDFLPLVARETGQQLEDFEAALERERTERADLEDAVAVQRAENERYERAIASGDRQRDRLQAAIDSLSAEKAELQGSYDTLVGTYDTLVIEHGILSETANGLTADVAFYSLAHESYVLLEERTTVEREYSDLAISLCGSVEEVANCPTDNDGILRLETLYSRYLEAHEAALAAYNAYTTAYQGRVADE